MQHYTKRQRRPKVYFTPSERTEKNYTVADAIRAAQVIIDNRFGPNPKPPKSFDELMDGFLPVDLGLLNYTWLGEKLTLVEVNQISTMLSENTISRAYLGCDADADVKLEFR
jgi:hypothetical protein